MRPVLKLTSVVVIASCLFIASLFSIWAAPTNNQSIPRLLPPVSRPHLIQSSQAITFTPVATIYLPLVIQGGTPLPNNPPNIPSDPSPPHNATNVDVMINLTWIGGDPDAGDTVTYDVYLNANNSNPNTLICNDNSTTTCDPTGNLLYSTDYYWKVVATDNHNASSTSSIWHFRTGAAPCNTPGTPTLVSPGDGTTINDTTPTFDWNNASGADEYQLQVDNNPDFASPEIDIATASSDYTPSSPLSDDTYSWRVRGHNTGNGCDVYGSWSSVWSVSIDTTPEPGLLFDDVLHLDGIDDYAVAPDSSNLDVGDEPSESFTLEAWFLVDDVHPSSPQFVLIADKSGSYALLARLLSLSNCLEWQVFGDPGISVLRTCSEDLITSGWHHVALVFDNIADQLSLYMDGQRVTDPRPFTDLVLNSTGEFHVGGLSEGNWFAGRIEEVRLSASARYTGETYTLPGPFAFVCDGQTRALWHFDEPSGATTMYDGEDGNGSDCGGTEDTLTGMNGATTGP